MRFVRCELKGRVRWATVQSCTCFFVIYCDLSVAKIATNLHGFKLHSRFLLQLVRYFDRSSALGFSVFSFLFRDTAVVIVRTLQETRVPSLILYIVYFLFYFSFV